MNKIVFYVKKKDSNYRNHQRVKNSQQITNQLYINLFRQKKKKKK